MSAPSYLDLIGADRVQIGDGPAHILDGFSLHARCGLDLEASYDRLIQAEPDARPCRNCMAATPWRRRLRRHIA